MIVRVAMACSWKGRAFKRTIPDWAQPFFPECLSFFQDGIGTGVHPADPRGAGQCVFTMYRADPEDPSRPDVQDDVRANMNERISVAESRPPFPPFTQDTALQKVRMAEDGWNSRSPERVSLAYTPDSCWRNRSEFIGGRAEIVAFLQRKWAKELGYRLIKELWAFTGNRIAVRFAYEWHDDFGHWLRSYGNENWEFADNGLMCRRLASINDLPIKEADRKFHWDSSGPRPSNHPGLSDLGL